MHQGAITKPDMGLKDMCPLPGNAHRESDNAQEMISQREKWATVKALGKIMKGRQRKTNRY